MVNLNVWGSPGCTTLPGGRRNLVPTGIRTPPLTANTYPPEPSGPPSPSGVHGFEPVFNMVTLTSYSCPSVMLSGIVCDTSFALS